MKKMLVVLLAAALAVTALGVLGCGGDTGTAKEYTKTADEAFGKLEVKLDEMGTASEALITAAVTGNLAEITPEKLESVSAIVKEVTGEIETVSALYLKITDLEGVEDYVAYAEAMVNALTAQATSVKKGAELLSKLVPVLQTGDTAQISAAIQENMEDITGIQDLSKAVDAEFEKALKIKEDKNIEY